MFFNNVRKELAILEIALFTKYIFKRVHKSFDIKLIDVDLVEIKFRISTYIMTVNLSSIVSICYE